MKNTHVIILYGIILSSFFLFGQDPGDECSDPIPAIVGENNASGTVQYFSYTTQVDGYILVSSQPDSSGNEVDTYVKAYSSCDLENDLLGENDNATSGTLLSKLLLSAVAGQEFIFQWEDKYALDGFTWTIMEGEGSPELPDLIITNAVLDADNQVLTVSITNGGTISVESNLYLDLWVNNENWPVHCGDPYGDFYNPLGYELAPDSSITSEFDLSFLGAGVYEFYLSLDNACLVFESNEENNTYGPIDFVQYPGVENLSAGGLFRSVELHWDPLGNEDLLRLTNPNAFVNISESARNEVKKRHNSQNNLRRSMMKTRQLNKDNSGSSGTRDPGDSCEDPEQAFSGYNSGTGEDQWFTYTTTTAGYLVVSSQNESGDALWDTYLFVFADCDSGEVASNDDCCGYYGPSTVEIPIEEGQTYKIFWSGEWGPGSFTWMITEIPSEQLPELNISGVEVNQVLRSISFYVYNSSMVSSASEFWVDLWIDPVDFSFDCYPETPYGDLNYYVEYLGPSESIYLDASFIALEPGDHQIYLGVDMDCIQMESDETNNFAGPFTLSVPSYPEVTVLEYSVFRDEDVESIGVVTETSYLDIGLVDGNEYCYTVRASVSTGSESDSSQMTPPGEPVCVTTQGVFANLCPPEDFNGENLVELIEEDYVESLLLSWSPVGPVGSLVDTSFVPMHDYSTGSLTLEGITDSSSILAKNLSSGWLSFDLSNYIPGLVPMYTELNIQVTDAYNPIWSVTPMNTDPLVDTLETVYLDIIAEAGTPEAYGNFIESDDFQPGNYTYILNESVDSDLAEADTSQVFRMGVHCLDMSDFYFLEIDGWSGSNPPKLIVHYAPDLVVEFESTLSVPRISSYLLDPEYKRAISQDLEIEFLHSTVMEIPDSTQVPPDLRDESCENLVENPTHYAWGDLEWGIAILYPHVQPGVYSLQSLQFIDWAYMIDNSITADTARVVISLTDGYGRIQEILLDDTVHSNGYTGFLDLEGIQYEVSGSTYLKVSLFPLTPAGDVNADGLEDYAPFFMGDDGTNPTGLSGWDTAEDLEFYLDYINWSVDLCRNYLGDFTYCGMVGNYNLYLEDEMIAQTTHTQYIYTNPVLDSTMCYSVVAEYEQGFSSGTENCFTVFEHYEDSVSIDILDNLPWRFTLSQNFPNPFNPLTHINFILEQKEFVSLIVYDIMGKEIIRLENQQKDAGRYRVTWHGTDSAGIPVGSGIYFYRIEAGEFYKTRKMIYIK